MLTPSAAAAALPKQLQIALAASLLPSYLSQMNLPVGRWLPAVLLWLLLGSARAQPGGVVDSLRQRLATAPPDTSRVLLLDELCWQLSSSDLKQAAAYGRQGLALARQLRYRTGEMKCLTDLGNCATYASDHAAGTRYFLQALSLAQQEPQRLDIMGFAYNGLANLNVDQLEFAEAQRNLEKALALTQRTRSAADRALFGGNLANVLRNRKQFAAAEVQFRQALHLYDSLGNQLGRASCLTNMAQMAYDQMQLPKARSAAQRAIAASLVIGNDYYLGVNNELLGNVERIASNLAAAETYTRRGLLYAQRTGNAEVVANCYHTLAMIEEQRGNFRQAYDWQRHYQTAHDSLINTGKNAEIANLRVQFDTEQKESRIRELTQQGQVQQLRAERQQSRFYTLLLVLLGAAATLAAVIGLYIKLRHNRAELHEKNLALEASTRSKDRLYALIAHDLRSPVISFAGAAELMAHHLRRGAADQVQRLTEHVRQSAQTLHHLLDNLLGWAVAQTGELSCRPEPLPAATLLRECLDLYQPAAEAADVQLHLTAPEKLVLHADHNMAHLILRNLVGNALEATPRGGHVSLSATPVPHAPGWLRLAVTDTGPGMAPAQLEALLAPDRQPHAPGRQRGGAGLGLLLCRAFAERHGGQFGIDSAPGQGSTAWVTLPAQQ
ncbi:HAMP domain-containing sensor histidine kinase [Hymenobacter sp. ASUV-10]|uniref:histidine kinase n=1 Tax=Hymenobacter aranciens TaxID=3063996 RepID=A0ABT9BGQ2_9BACT|nr:HAMP domain-containing sensor histidine kinase [Hymenobacter sp. ASUV-10]MDO7877426.1 HAMP domain-containing sensor histidine kinase [Hymenobacter sp. ASUV-10]